MFSLEEVGLSLEVIFILTLQRWWGAIRVRLLNFKHTFSKYCNKGDICMRKAINNKKNYETTLKSQSVCLCFCVSTKIIDLNLGVQMVRRG